MKEPSGKTKEPKLDADSNTVPVSKGRTIVLIVTMALLLDYMLLTVIIPIIPEILHRIETKDHKLDFTTSPVIYPTQTHLTNLSNEITVRSPSLTNSKSVPSVSIIPIPYQNKSVKLEQKIFANNMHLNKTNTDGYIAKPNEEVTLPELVHRKNLTDKRKKENKISDESLKVGILLASKAFFQLLVNPFVGCLTDRIGYKTPMVIGFSIMVISTLAFAFGSNYASLFFARAFQGIGSSCVGVSGMAVLAQSYPKDNERGKVIGIALSGGLAVGCLIGPPFGGFMSEFVGKSSPFLVLAMLSSIGLLLQLFIIYPKVKQTSKEVACSMILIQNPHILIVTGSLMLSNMAVAMLESSLPIMMMDRMEVDSWQIGAIFLPCTLSYMVGSCLFGRIAFHIGRWFTALLGLYLLGGACVFVVFTYKPEFLIAPMAFTGFGIGMVSSSMFPELGHLADLHHTESYGSVYAMGDIAVCLGFFIGPALSGGLAKLIGFKWMAVITSLLCFAYGPLLFILKRPQKLDSRVKEELPLIHSE